MKPSFDTGSTGNGRKVRNFQINPKKKMRPGPATQAALLADVSTCLSPHKAAKCALSNLASPKECSFLHALCVKPATQSCCLRRTL